MAAHLAQTLPRGGGGGSAHATVALPALDPRRSPSPSHKQTSAMAAMATATAPMHAKTVSAASPAKRHTASGSSGGGSEPPSQSPAAAAAAAWRPYGTERIREREVLAAGRSRQANAARIAQVLQDVRRLEREPQSAAPYPSTVQSVPTGAQAASFHPYQRVQGSSRPNSASVTLPAVEGALPAAAPSSILRPVGGVDDPLLHAHVSTSATGTSFVYTSQRLADLAASKHARHFAALESYNDQRASIDRQLNAQVESLCEGLRQRCEQLESPIRTLLLEVMSDEHRLVRMDAAAIQQARMEFDDNYRTKQADIDRTVLALEGVESERQTRCTAAIEQLVSNWLEVAHVQPAEAERLLADETLELNAHLLRNRASAHELGSVLGAELVVKQQERYERQWETRWKRWKVLRHKYFIDEFVARFQWDEEEAQEIGEHDEEEEREYPFQYSRRKRRAFEEIKRHGRGFSEWASDIVMQMLRLSPKNEPEQLRQRVSDLADQLQQGYLVYDSRTDGLVQRVATVEREIQSRAEAMVHQLRSDLVHGAGAHTEAEIDAQIASQILPMLEERSAREEGLLRRVEKCMKHFDGAFLRAVDHFSSFYLRAAERWEEFQRGVGETNTHFHEALAERRDEFDAQLSGLEAQLRESVSLLSREPRLEALDARLKEVRSLVGPEGAIEESYRAFYADSVGLTQRHPRELGEVCEGHRAALAQHFGLRTPGDLAKESLALSTAQVAAAAAAAAAEEAAEAALSKRDRAKRDKDKAAAKIAAEKAAEKAAEEERRAKLARVKERAAAQAKEEMKAAAMAKLQAQAAAAAASQGADDATTEGSDAAATAVATGASPSKSRPSPQKQTRKSDDELLRELEEVESAARALDALHNSIETKQLCYDYDTFADHMLHDTSLVKLVQETPLHKLGLVEILSGELDFKEPEVVENEQPLTVVETERIKQYIVEPLRIREAEAAATAAAEAALARTRSPSPGKKSRVNMRSPSPAASPSRAAAATAAANAAAEAAPAASTLPYLSLPSGVLQFHIFLDQQALLDRILSGESSGNKAKHARNASTAGLTVTTPAFAVGASGESTERSGAGDMQMGGGALETAGEAAEAAAAAAISEAQAALAAATAAATGPPAPTADASSTPASKKPKTKAARAAAAEEEAARLRAEEERRAKLQSDEEACLAALVAATAPPSDAQGFSTVHPLEFPRHILGRMIGLVRENFLLTLEWHARRAREDCVALNESLAMDLLKELNLLLRQHRPRFNRIEVDVYEQRAKTLASNLASYNRLVGRLNDGYGLAVGGWEGTLLRGEREVLLFKRRAQESMQQLSALSSDPAASLASIQAVNTAIKGARLAFTRTMTAEVFERLSRETKEFQAQFQAKIRAFISACQSKQFGSHSSPDHEGAYGRTGALLEELDAQGNVVSSNKRGTNINNSVECYHPDEVDHYASMLDQFSTGYSTLLAEQAAKEDALRSKYDDALALKEFNESYALNKANLSIQQGLGHANGAPKRALTVGVRTEFHRSEAQQEFIDALLDELDAANRGALVVGSASATAAAGGSRNKTPSNGSGVEEHKEESHDPASDLAASFASLTVVPLSAPTAARARAPNLALHMLHTIDQLRRALLARAQYLAALKPNLPAFVLQPQAIALDPQQQQEQDDAARAGEVAAAAGGASEAEEDPLSSRGGRTSSRGSKRTGLGAGSGAAAEKKADDLSKQQADLAKKPPAPLRRSGTLAFKGDAGAAASAAAAAATASASSSGGGGESSARPFPSFIQVIESHIDVAKRQMHSLVAQYEAQYPDRKVPLAVAAPPTPGAGGMSSRETGKEEEEKKNVGSNKKKGSGEDKKAASRSKKNDAGKNASGGSGGGASGSAADSSDSAVPPAIEEHCASEHARSLAHLEAAHKTLLRQTDRASTLLASVAPRVLQDVFERVVQRQLVLQLQRVEGAFSTRHSASQAAATRHRAKLKPSLASRPDQSIEQLRSSEDARWKRSVASIRAFRADVLQLLQHNGQDLTRQLLHCSSALLGLVDSLVLPLDLSNVLRDGGDVFLSGRKSIDSLAKEARRLRLTKEAVAEQAGMTLDALGAVVSKQDSASAAVSAAAAAAGAAKTRTGSASKKSKSVLDSERAAADAARIAGAELAAKLDPRFLRISWPGLRVADLELPEGEEERQAREEARERARAAEAAATARERDAAAGGTDSRKKKRAAKEKAASAMEEANGTDDSGSPAGSPPGSATGSKRPAAAAGASSLSAAGGGRRNKKQQQADEAAAAAAAVEAARVAAESAVQTPPVSALNQPTQRAIVHSRNAVFAQYVALYQQQARAVLDSTQQLLDAERKARQEWETQVHLLTNPEPLQF